MQRALVLARRASGRTSPNPAVGAVIVKDGCVLGEGHTQPPGGKHAEIMALEQAGVAAAGATLYVTLEPCCHFGRTPPCTRAIVGAGVAVVEVATVDPNPLVAGKGCAELRVAGITVRVGCGEAEARQQNEAFAKYITTGLPFVTAKWAMTLDGKIATYSGHSRWVTGEVARERVHLLRDVSDAVLVGVGTVIADDPALTVRLPAKAEVGERAVGRPPLRVVVDSRGRAPMKAQLFSSSLANGTLVATTAASDPSWRKALASRGVSVVVLPDEAGRVDLKALVIMLAERERIAVLVEGGGVLIAGLLQHALVDKVYAFVAPKIVGGASAPSPVGGEGFATMDQALHLGALAVEKVGEDVLLIGYPSYGLSERRVSDVRSRAGTGAQA